MNNFYRTILILCSLLVDYVSCRCECLNRIVLLHTSDDFRIISSPDYPRPYCSNLDCIWRIVSPDNSTKLYFYADNLDLRDGEDEIIFYDGKFVMESDNDTENHVCSGTELCRFVSSGQYLTIRFRSSYGTVDNYGFQGIVSTKDKPIYGFSEHHKTKNPLLSTLHEYCIPLLVLCVILLAVFVSIICCTRNKPRSTFRRYNHPDVETTIKKETEKYRNIYRSPKQPTIRRSV